MSRADTIQKYIKTSLVIVLAMVFAPSYSNGQFLQQKIEQIAKLELYLVELKKGYDIVQKGLTTIGEIKKGDLDLHSLFFNSLQVVNPVVKNYIKIADVIVMQIQMISDYHSYYTKFQDSHSFSSKELSYFQSVYDNILNLTGKDIDALTTVLSDGKLQMSDDERINRINVLYVQVLDKYEFIHSFGNRVQVNTTQRAQSIQELSNLKKLF